MRTFGVKSSESGKRYSDRFYTKEELSAPSCGKIQVKILPVYKQEYVMVILFLNRVQGVASVTYCTILMKWDHRKAPPKASPKSLQCGRSKSSLASSHKPLADTLAFHYLWSVDGLSRFIVKSNKKAANVYRCFQEETSKYGTSLRVRSDQGMEKMLVAEYMVRKRGVNRRSMITDKSSHNQPMERLRLGKTSVANCTVFTTATVHGRFHKLPGCPSAYKDRHRIVWGGGELIKQMITSITKSTCPLGADCENEL
ncbi:hypothetical protein MAR_022031 [Mya arenaria]|uniref:Integrase core domain-containing protein n=1 Tax=Mya arenaria TaxID=6604 RepID=A0ABY7ECI2_MYAAR|nr:hypothetical protein MAR_022031 [Mya arenaria]